MYNINQIRAILTIPEEIKDEEILSIFNDIVKDTGICLEQILEIISLIRLSQIDFVVTQSLKEIEEMYSMYEYSEKHIEEREPLPPYREKLHPLKYCKKQYWLRTRSNPRMRVNRSLRQKKRDGIWIDSKKKRKE